MDIWQIAYKLAFTLCSYVTTVNLKKINCPWTATQSWYTTLPSYWQSKLWKSNVPKFKLLQIILLKLLNCYPMHTTYCMLHFYSWIFWTISVSEWFIWNMAMTYFNNSINMNNATVNSRSTIECSVLHFSTTLSTDHKHTHTTVIDHKTMRYC